MTADANKRMAWLTGAIIVLDQLTKFIVLKKLNYENGEEKVIIDGFFKFVQWRNTGAAWSMFFGQNEALAIISLLALLVLFIFRHRFESNSLLGQISLGLIFGGIVGNLIDRLFRNHVIDFIYFYLYQRNGREIGFPAFNVADTAICTGVGLLFLLSWKQEQDAAARRNLARENA
jgi:signal peptidase II